MADYREVGRLIVPIKEEVISPPIDKHYLMTDEQKYRFSEEWLEATTLLKFVAKQNSIDLGNIRISRNYGR